MNKFICVLLVCCGSATNIYAKDEKSSSLNELNPITRYVNVCQQVQAEGKGWKFVLCDSKDKSCVQPKDRTIKHLATAK